jgi:hypothetical protein
MTGVPPLIEVVVEEESASAHPSLSAVACRIIVSSPIWFATFPVRIAGKTLCLFYACPAPDGPV